MPSSSTQSFTSSFSLQTQLSHEVVALDLPPLILVPNPTFLSWDRVKGNRLPRKRGSRLRYRLHPLRAPNPPSGFLSLYRMQPAIRRPCPWYSRPSEALARLPSGIFCGRPVCQTAYGIWARSLLEATGLGLQDSFAGGSGARTCICGMERVSKKDNLTRGKGRYTWATARGPTTRRSLPWRRRR
jgi:hypothetical protein